MNPQASQQNPAASSQDGDFALWACDQRDPRTLSPGLYHDGRNVRCTDGRPETRKGVLKPAWANRVMGDLVQSHGQPYGAGTFQDPNGTEWLFIAADGYCWRMRPYNVRVSIPLPTGVRLFSNCTFVQAFNELYCFRGRFLAPLRLTDLITGFIDLIPHWDAAATYDAAILSIAQVADEIAYGPYQDVTSITRVGDTATVVTTLAHGYITGADVTIQGAVETAYNGRFNITVVDEFTFTYECFGSPTTPATGNIKVSNDIFYWKALGSQVVLSDGAPITLSAGQLTSAATTATVVHTAHGYVTGDWITIAGAAQAEYNGTYLITRIDANTFTYTFAGSATTPATGTITTTKRALTRTGGTATASFIGHGFSAGQTVTIAGATASEYNGPFIIAVPDANHFMFTVTGAPATPATPATGITAHTSIVLAGQSPDTSAAAWQRIYDVMPNANNALYINGRLLIPTAYEPASVDDYATFSGGTYSKVDFVVATSYLDTIHFDFADEFRINQGSDDEIIDLGKVPNEDAVIVWKGHSWGILSNVRLDLAELTFDLRTQIYGLSTRGAWAVAGADVQFLSNRRGVVSITQSEQGKLIGSDVPLSAPIQATIDRIDWTRISEARLANWSNRLYAAVPIAADMRNGPNLFTGQTYTAQVMSVPVVVGTEYLFVAGVNEQLTAYDGATPLPTGLRFTAVSGSVSIVAEIWPAGMGLPVTAQLYVPGPAQCDTRILVFDFTAAAKLGDKTQGWTPQDTGSALAVFEWVKLQLDGQERLFYLSNDGWVNLMEESDRGDQVENLISDTGLGWEEIETMHESRSLAGAPVKSGLTKPVDGLVWLETFNPKYTIEILFGNALRKTTVRTDKTRSATRYTRPYGAPDWVPSNINEDHATAYRQDYRLAIATAGVQLGDGVKPLQFAETPERFHLNGRQARDFRVRATNTQGRVKLRSVALDSVPGRDRRGVLA